MLLSRESGEREFICHLGGGGEGKERGRDEGGGRRRKEDLLLDIFKSGGHTINSWCSMCGWFYFN